MGNDTAFSAQQVFVARTVLRHADALAKHIHAVRLADDIEAVHQMRVASRRLRNALRLFESYLPHGRRRKWLKRTAQAAKALGLARDLDVQIEFIDGFIKGLSTHERSLHEQGLTRLRLRLQQHRDLVQHDVVTAMDRLEASGVVEDLQQTLRHTLVEAKASKVKVDSPQLRQEAIDTTLHQLEEMLVFDPYVRDSHHVVELHQMRIAAKHLRYTLEAYALLYRNKFKPQIKTTRSIQTLLGDIRDCDVWIEFLPRFLERESARFASFLGHTRGFSRVRRGVSFLLDNRQIRRDELHQRFIEFWDNWNATDLWAQWRRQIESNPPLSSTVKKSTIITENKTDPSSTAAILANAFRRRPATDVVLPPFPPGQVDAATTSTRDHE